jgi:hypothetical protein
MSPLRMPQHLAEPQHVDSGEAILRFELLEELDGLHRSEARVEQALRALRDCDAVGGYGAERTRLIDTAADAVWRLIVQHEACDCCDHNALISRYRIPAEVMARVGGSR